MRRTPVVFIAAGSLAASSIHVEDRVSDPATLGDLDGILIELLPTPTPTTSGCRAQFRLP